MAKFFDYSRVSDVYSTRGAALPGQFTTDAGMTTFAAVAGEDLEPGQAVQITVENGVVIASNCTNADKLAGIVLLDVHAQVSRDSLKHEFINKFEKGSTVSVVRKGYVWIPIENATPTVVHDGSVYLRSVADAGKLVGGFATAADSSNNAVINGVKLTGNVGFPLSGKNNGTTSTAVTGRTAEVKVELGLL